MTAGSDNDGGAGRTAEEWKRSRPSVGDSCWRQSAARLRAGRGHKGMGGQEEGSKCVVIPDSSKLVELLVMVINQKGQRVRQSVLLIIFSSGNIICGVSSMDHIKLVCHVIFQKTPFYQRSKLLHGVNVFCI